ncbi:MAG: carbamoyl-phosphate synthase large subunit, partial [Firmicutes bacterium]|nr:carbamoyl-phosphate synthase large subunit [Bacillota bacterium]
MTDSILADEIYLEPLTLTTVKRIIEKERPDSLLAGLGGQTGLNLAMLLSKEGYLEKMGVRLLGTKADAIDKAEDRELFKQTMLKIGKPVIPSMITTDMGGAIEAAKSVGYPVIIRPAFTLGGTGGGVAHDESELKSIAASGLFLSPIGQILVEKYIYGWKEIEFEVMRDKNGNSLAVCSMENVDPVGVHTGDSIVVAPALTLAQKEYAMLKNAALDIIEELKIEGGCNCQFALDPQSHEYAVIEVNPRVSRSSALASKATGYPIAKVTVKIALGYTLDEIKNDITGETTAQIEPDLDYVVVKLPKWPFDKFLGLSHTLGTQMKATGEVMSIAPTFHMALLKAVRGAEIGALTLSLSKLETLKDTEIKKMLQTVTDERVFLLYEALRRGFPIKDIYKITMVDPWFLNALFNLCVIEEELREGKLTEELFIRAKKAGYTDKTIEKYCGKFNFKIDPVYKIVDTCAGEYKAATPYFYSMYSLPAEGGENEALAFTKSSKNKVVVLGSGPIRIGQGIEFDYASVHCVRALKKVGYEVIVINNNPETVSTDFDIADRLYFEPLNIEDVLNIIKTEKPLGVIAAFGGGTAIKLTQDLKKAKVNILGTSAESIDLCEERKRFDELMESLNIMRPKGFTCDTLEGALDAAKKLGYPVLMRPSYVLGGQNMIIAFCDEDIKEYMEIILRTKFGTILIDKYIQGLEAEVDAICDGEEVLLPGVMEHIERTGIHSGDSIAVYPALHIDDEMAERIFEVTKKICLALKIKGIVNIQFVIKDNQIYIIEVNPRASRTVPYISKVTGINICEFATRALMGETLKDLGVKPGIAKMPPYVAVKVPVFSFEKLTDVDTHLGPEMKSTGEVLGLGKNLQEALYKGLKAAGYKLGQRKGGGVFITVRDSDKNEIIQTARKFQKMGLKLYATDGTAQTFKRSGLDVIVVNKIYENKTDNIMTLLESGKIDYIISTSAKGRDPARDSVKIRRKACSLGIPCLTSIDTANAIAESGLSGYTEQNVELININNMRKSQLVVPFSKLQTGGVDFIYIDNRSLDIPSPESLAVHFCNRIFGIGADGIVLIEKSKIAAAKIRIFDSEGTELIMSSNVIRCVGKFLYDNKITKHKNIKIETRTGVKELSLSTLNGRVSKVKLNFVGSFEKVENLKSLTFDGQEYKAGYYNLKGVSCVVFCEDADSLDLTKYDKTHAELNIYFASVIDKHLIKVRCLEKGHEIISGCGASVSAYDAVKLGYCDINSDISVLIKENILTVNYDGENVYLTSGVYKTFSGEIQI